MAETRPLTDYRKADISVGNPSYFMGPSFLIYSINRSNSLEFGFNVESTPELVTWTGHVARVVNYTARSASLLIQSNIPVRIRYGILLSRQFVSGYDFTAEVNSDQLGIGFYSFEYTINALDELSDLYGYSYTSLSSAIDVLSRQLKAIKYNLTNCTAPGAPANATPGNTVSVPLRFPTGYSVINPESDVVVRNNGIRVSANYSTDQSNTGTVTFVMP